MSYIALEINIGSKTSPNWQFAVLKENTSISIENSSAIWDTSDGGGAFSYEFELPVEENLHILGTSCEMRGVSIYKQLYGKQFRLYAGGLCMFYGIVKLDESVEIEKDEEGNRTVGISLNADNWEWEDMLEGVNARDVTLATSTRDDNTLKITIDEGSIKIPIGYCVPSYFPIKIPLKGTCRNDQHADAKIKGYIYDSIDTSIYIPKVLLVKSKTHNFDYTNTSEPYDPSDPFKSPFCNTRICYQHYEQTGDEEWTSKRGYGIGETDRINSAPCFYVMFWMDMLFKALGVKVTKNAMHGYDDLKRLAFFHTNCGYEEEETTKPLKLKEMNFKSDYLSPEEGNITDIPEGVAMTFVISDIEKNTIWPVDDTVYGKNESGGDITITGCKRLTWDIIQDSSKYKTDWEGIRWLNARENLNDKTIVNTVLLNMPLYQAYANSNNFPSTDAKEVLDGIQNAFGIRYLYDAKSGTLEIIMVKDVLASKEIASLACEVHEVTKTENHVTGFRLKYSAAEESSSNYLSQQEELTGVKKGTEGSDTTFSYNNYTNPKVLDMTGTDKKGYGWLLGNITPYDMTCYVHPKTGNAFRIKVDGDSKGGDTLYPSLFEVGQFQSAKWGNCSNKSDNKDFVEEVSIGFTPVIENDINCAEEKIYNPDMDASATGQIFAQLVDGEMHSYDKTDNEEGNAKIGNLITSSVKFQMPINRTYKSYVTYYAANNEQKNRTEIVTPVVNTYVMMQSLISWDLSDEMPTETNDTGFMLGIMRGSGSDAHTTLYDYDYGGENNSKWMTVPGSKATFCSDSVDQYGYYFDYNGIGDGLGHGNGGAISLRLKAEKENPGYDPTCSLKGFKYSEDKKKVTFSNGTTVPNEKYFPIDTSCAKRGLADKFYNEYAYWVLNRKIANITCTMELADLINIDMTKRYRIGEYEGFIKQLSYTIDNESGLSPVEIEFYYL